MTRKVKSFKTDEVAENLKSQNGFIPGIRPGKNTAEYMNKILTKITVVGGLYLALLSLIPEIMISGIKLQPLPLMGNWIDTYFKGDRTIWLTVILLSVSAIDTPDGW